MNVVLTGAFGNLGHYTIDEVLARGHRLRTFDLPTPANQRRAARYGTRLEALWGDVRRPQDCARAVAAQDVVIHTAFIIPPSSELCPDRAEGVNVGGTGKLLAAMQAQPTPPRLIFTSSYAIYGDTQQMMPPITLETPIRPLEHYSRHKVACEQMIRESALTWCILRMPAIQAPDPLLSPERVRKMFQIALDLRIESAHPADAAVAVANAVSSAEVWGKTLLIGGGATYQLRYGDWLQKFLDASGVGMFPADAFAPEPFHCDWVDSREGEALLHYQRRTLDDFLADVRRTLGWRRHAARLLRPLVRWWLLRYSPVYERRARQGVAST